MVDIQAINGDAKAAATGIECGRELMTFAEAFATRDEAGLARARDILQTHCGDAVLVDAAGVAANFQRMVRIADATGIPVDSINDPLSVEVRQALGLDRFPSSANALSLGGDEAVECATENGQ